MLFSEKHFPEEEEADEREDEKRKGKIEVEFYESDKDDQHPDNREKHDCFFVGTAFLDFHAGARADQNEGRKVQKNQEDHFQKTDVRSYDAGNQVVSYERQAEKQEQEEKQIAQEFVDDEKFLIFHKVNRPNIRC